MTKVRCRNSKNELAVLLDVEVGVVDLPET